MLGMIWAQANGRVIGRDGTLPWRLPEDMAHFRATTGSDPVIHGRASWDALPPKYRPLPGRRNIVLTRNPHFVAEGAEVVTTLEDALALVAGQDAWICGGAQVYAAAMDRADLIVMTQIDLNIDGDTYAPEIPADFRAAVGPWRESASGIRFRVETYRRR